MDGQELDGDFGGFWGSECGVGSWGGRGGTVVVEGGGACCCRWEERVVQ